MRHTAIQLLALLLLALLSINLAQGQPSSIPQMINYQGYLTDANGKALTSERYTLYFSIYATASAATPLWGPKVMSDVPVVDGHFNIILGPTDGATDAEGKQIALAFTSPEAYLAIKVGDGDWMEPRQKILSSPYAMNGVPAGTIVAFGGPEEKVPLGWFVCNNSAKTIADYPALYNAIGKSWGGDDTHFRLPDLRGRFLRGLDMGTGRDPDRNGRQASEDGGNVGNNVGTIQGYATAKPKGDAFSTSNGGAHSHTTPTWNGQGGPYETASAGGGYDYGEGAPTSMIADHAHYIQHGGDSETRPVNANVVFIIKF